MTIDRRLPRPCRTTLALTLLASCHSPAVQSAPKPAAGAYALDGYYQFRLEYVEGTEGRLRLNGAFVIADTQVLWSEPGSCTSVPTPQASEGREMAWFECGARSMRRKPIQLRIHRTDPINKSRWFADVPLSETQRGCRRYLAGSCTQFVPIRVIRYVARSGTLAITRGLSRPSEVPPAAPRPDRTHRTRCDTIATSSCAG